ncbi:MAG: 50S ribosomal protein L29 [Alphaproteobacteria bacterium]
MTKIIDIRAKSLDELKADLLELRKEQLNLRFQQAAGGVGSTARIRAVRRDIAKIKTVLGERKGKLLDA